MSRKSVPFTVRGGPSGQDSGPGERTRRGPETIDARSDEWVSDRNTGASETGARRPDLMLDLAAERSLTEIVALSFLTPVALTGFWLLHWMQGRARF